MNRVSGGTIAEYRYNAFGQRAWKDASGQQLSFAYGLDGTLLGEYDALAGTHKEFIYADGVPLAQVESGSVVYLHTDHLDTARVASDDFATVVWRWDSDPFGEAAPDEDPDGDSNLVSIPLRFPGQYADAESGEYYNYFRTYDPSIGRYTQSDPIGLAGGLNTYAYVRGNPLLLVDSFGLADDGIGDRINRPGPTDQSGRQGRTGNPISERQRAPRNAAERLVNRGASSLLQKLTGRTLRIDPSTGRVILGNPAIVFVGGIFLPGPMSDCQIRDCDGDGFDDMAFQKETCVVTP